MLMPVVCEIAKNETSQTLHDKLSELAVKPLLETLSACLQGFLNPQKQDDSLATYAPKIHKEQAVIDWKKNTHEIDCQIRAFNPWPVAYALMGNEACRIHEASVERCKTSAKPGEIIAKTRQALSVACCDGIIHITRLQFPGGRAMSVSDWMNGSHHKISVGECFHV
jgi:methionyl-tRNA formyltransferase